MLFETPRLKDIPNVFDFEYDFYTTDANIKGKFEDLFKRGFAYRHIAFDDVDEFKHYLKYKLDEIAPYYIQLYETEVEARKWDFLMNKDYTETFKRVNNTEKNVDEKNNSITNTDNSLDVTNRGSDLTTANNDLKSTTDTTTNASTNTLNNKEGRDTGDSISKNRDNSNTFNRGTDTTSTLEEGGNKDTLTKENTNKASNVADGVADVSLTKGLTGIVNDNGRDTTETEFNKDTTNSQNFENYSNTDNLGEQSTNSTTTTNIIDKTDQTANNREIGVNNTTGINKTVSNTEDFSKTKGLSNSITKGDITIKDLYKGVEEYELRGAGNIGITSTADLLTSWRSCILNTNKLILNELAELFIMLY